MTFSSVRKLALIIGYNKSESFPYANKYSVEQSLIAKVKYAKSTSGVAVINPRPTGTPDFPPPTVVLEHISLSRLLLVVEKKGKQRSKARQKWLRNYFSQFFAKVKIVTPGPKND